MAADAERWRAAAAAIARTILAEARYAKDGGIYWRVPDLPGREGLPPPLDTGLYPGSTGLALFFALAGRQLGDPDYRRIAYRVLAPLRAELGRLAQDPERQRSLEVRQGGLVGAGSWIYGLVRCGDLLADPSLWDEALELSGLVGAGRLSRSGEFELMEGVAGSLLALLALDARRPTANRLGETPLELAHEAGRALLAGRPAWVGEEGGAPEIAGFCHGAAGIAYALTRLARHLPEALGPEGELPKPLPRAPPPPSAPAPGMAHSWCNGQTGLLLARLEQDASPAELAALEADLRLLAAAPLDRTDHLCCGNAGRLDLLVHAAGRLGSREWLVAAGELAGRMLDRAAAEGGFRLMFHPEGRNDVRLFPGLAGIGYALLRLADPASLPSVLGLA